MQLFFLEILDLLRQFLCWFVHAHEILFNQDLIEDSERSYLQLAAPFAVYWALLSSAYPMTHAAMASAGIYGGLALILSVVYRAGVGTPSFWVEAFLPSRSRIGLIYTFRLLGALAKSDGRVSEEEIARVTRYMDEELRLDETSRPIAINAFRAGTRSVGQVEFYGLKLRLLMADRKNILLVIRAMLIDLAGSDGRISTAERQVLYAACDALNVPRPGQEGDGTRVDEGRSGSGRERHAATPRPSTDPYFVLGLSRDAETTELKRRYRKLCREYHPDAGMARGLPKQYVSRMAEQFKTLQQAWQQICQERSIK